MNRFLLVLLLLPFLRLAAAPPPDPPEEEMKDYKQNGSGIILNPSIEELILKNHSEGTLIVYVSKAAYSKSRNHEYVFITLGISYPNHWEGISHYRLIARKEQNKEWSEGDILVPSGDVDLKASPRGVDDETIEKNSHEWK